MVCGMTASAQRNEIVDSQIASLQVMSGDDASSPAIIELNGNGSINIAFDDLTHEYRRFAYRLEHCEADWTVSEELFQSDYCHGFADGNTIDDVTESINTNILYTHYSLTIPNEKCAPKMSGNYRLTIYDENDSNVAAVVCFMIVEPLMSLQMSATSNTDIEMNGRYQQLEMQLDYEDVRVTNPKTEIATIVMQNGRWDNAVVNPSPQYYTPHSMRWQHCRALIFNGGNEYRKFETLSTSHSTMGIERVEWDGADYHSYLWTDEPRPNYVYDEDDNGGFYIRNSDNIENDYASEYVYVHFTLKCPKSSNDIYINGNWTYDRFLPQYKMEYDEQAQLYGKTVLLKQGYYSYQYLEHKGDGIFAPLTSEGNFYETENEYQCLIYYKGVGQRSDRLVGYGEVSINRQRQ